MLLCSPYPQPPEVVRCSTKQWGDDIAEAPKSHEGLWPGRRHYLIILDSKQISPLPHREALALSSQAVCLGMKAVSASAHKVCRTGKTHGKLSPNRLFGSLFFFPFGRTENVSSYSSSLLRKKGALYSTTLKWKKKSKCIQWEAWL